MKHAMDSQTIKAGFFNKNAFKKEKNKLLVLKTAIAGLAKRLDLESEETKTLLKSLVPGTELLIYRDMDNEHDKWAISVYTTDHVNLGYITRFKNETLARLMDAGKKFYVFVDEIPDPPKDEVEKRRTMAPTEDYTLPFSVYMDE